MDHVASVPSAASGRMSPEARSGWPSLLHAAAALALWWLAANRPTFVPPEEPIEITVERPKPPEPPPPPTKPQPQAQGQSRSRRHRRPSRGCTAGRDQGGQANPGPALGRGPEGHAGPPPRSLEEPVPRPPQPTPPPTEAAMAPPKPKSTVPPPDRQASAAVPAADLGPPIESLPPPRPKPEPPPPPWYRSPAAAPAVTTVQPPPPPHSADARLTRSRGPTPQMAPASQRRPPATANRDTPTRSLAVRQSGRRPQPRAGEQNYLWQIVRKLRLLTSTSRCREDYIMVRLVIARDGRLLAADVVQSSGTPAIDQAVLAGVRRARPTCLCRPRSAATAQPSSGRSTLRARFYGCR